MTATGKAKTVIKGLVMEVVIYFFVRKNTRGYSAGRCEETLIALDVGVKSSTNCEEYLSM
jgi:hypothetical protein